jgi:hypothetical protein
MLPAAHRVRSGRHCAWPFSTLSLSSQAHFAQEASISERVLDLARALSPSNQALLLSFFARGSPSCLRIARAVAYHVLTGLAIQPVRRALLPVHYYITDVAV